MAETIVVAGFNRFGPQNNPNPSSEIIIPAVNEKYAGVVATVTMETAYDKATDVLRGIIREVQPEAVVIFGTSQPADPFRLEQRARNWRQSKNPDNLGQHFLGKITMYGSEYLGSTLPLNQIAEAFEERQVPYRFSDSAGTFVCNDTFYQLIDITGRMHRNQHHQIRAGLIHFGRELVQKVIEEGAYAAVDTLSSSGQLPQ